MKSPRGLDKALFAKLVAGDWITRHQGLLICGATGTGKSWLACALGHKACRDNRSVLYQRVPRLFDALALARGDGRHVRVRLGPRQPDSRAGSRTGQPTFSRTGWATGLGRGSGTLGGAAGTAEASSVTAVPLSDAGAPPLVSLADPPTGSGKGPRVDTAEASAAALLAPPLVASGSTLTGIDTPLLFMMASICVSPDGASELASAAPPSLAEGGTAGLAPGGGLPAPPSEAAFVLTTGMGGPTTSVRAFFGEIWLPSSPPAAAVAR